VKNLLLVRLQLGGVVCHLPLIGGELGCELVDALANEGQADHKLLQFGRSGSGRRRHIGSGRHNRCGVRRQPAKLQ
jgi:hypothetical protein